LAVHVERCPACADRVRRVSQVHASLMLLGSQPLPANLHARANGRALRMLRRVTRASAASADLLRMRPNLSPWQRVQLYVARISLSAVAALIVLIIRVGILSGLERTQALGQALASAHWDRHIDPDHEWLDRMV
jgi:anti-sigma factor RsiW